MAVGEVPSHSPQLLLTPSNASPTSIVTVFRVRRTMR